MLTDQLREDARQNLIDVLDSLRGKKGLVLDNDLSGPLSLIAEFPLLKEHGVEKIFHLEKQLNTDVKSLIYLTRPTVRNMKMIADHVKNRKDEENTEFAVFMVPRKTLICEKVLEDEGVYGDIHISEYGMDIIPLEDDTLSLELNDAFADLYLRKDTSCIFLVAKAIMKLQKATGVIPRILGKGEYAKILSDHLLRMRRETPGLNTHSLEMDSVVIVERSSDLITPLCTQLTYEGLLDEFFGIDSTFIPVHPSLLGNSTLGPNQGQKSKKIPLNSSDKLYSQIRDLNFAVIGNVLSQNAKRLHEDYEERHQAKTVTQIKDFVGKLGGLQTEHQSLKLHTNLAEDITKRTRDQDFNRCLEVQQNVVAGIINTAQLDYIEELIAKQMPLTVILRLLCLYSLVSGGLKPKQLDFFRREIIQTYGFKHLLTLVNLRKIGLLKAQDASKNPYMNIKKAFRLIVDDVNEHDPNDISYVYSGFAPISIRLVQIACFNSLSSSIPTSATEEASKGQVTSNPVKWKGWEDNIRLLPGPTIEVTQKSLENLYPKRSKQAKKTTLVVFLGGCTYTEISALRFLSQKNDGREFLILTTNLMNGGNLINSLVEKTLLS